MTLSRIGGAILMVALSAPAMAGDCAETFTTDALDEQLDEAMLAFASLDEAGFITASAKSAVMVSCVDEPFTPSLAAAYHRVNAVRFFVSGQETEARDSLRAAFGIDADATLSTRIAPEGGKLFRMQEEALGRPARATGSLEVPDGYRMFVDGSEGSDVPKDAPHIVQLLDDGQIAFSGVLLGGGSLPAEFSGDVVDLDPIDLDLDDEPDRVAVGADPEPKITDLDEPDRGRSSRERSGGGGANSGLVAAAAGTGVLAAGLYGVAVVSRLSYDKNPSAAKYHITNGSFIGAAGLGGVTVVLGGAALLGGGR
ncbi:MAG: hypothetical protein EP330_23040 [Deltaproteobacteria bacterium]|nr:MAG: hypothetical protein EP330_23040 [Deltaproteobacteria bacterium]